MLLLRLNPSSSEPLYKQIARQVAQLVERDTLKEGDILPPTRTLAAALGTSRFTVTEAYRELWVTGYVDSRSGSYTRVRARPKIASAERRRTANASTEWHFSRGALATAPSGASSSVLASGAIDLATMNLDERLFPVDDLRICFNRSLNRRQASLLNYTDARGHRPLREYVAARMRAHGVDADPEEILITHGSGQGLELAAKLLVDPGQPVILEAPTYPGALALFRFLGAGLESIPMRSDGMDLDALAAVLQRRGKEGIRPALLYTIPSFHNPTGVTTSQLHRERLLELCERHHVPVVEDSFQEEITYFNKVVLPLKSMDLRGNVLYLGTFSKVLFPGLRLGWVVAPREIIPRLTALKRLGDLSCSPFVQAALHRFCERGSYEAHLRRVNRAYAKRMACAVRALRRHLPEKSARFDPPSGGFLVWVRLETELPEERIGDILREAGVCAAPGSLFFAEPPRGRYLRLCFSTLNEPEIEEGVRRLGNALRRLETRPHSSRARRAK